MQNRYHKKGFHRRCRSLMLTAVLIASMASGVVPVSASAAADPTQTQAAVGETAAKENASGETTAEETAAAEESAAAETESALSDDDTTSEDHYYPLENTIVGIAAVPISTICSVYTEFMSSRNPVTEVRSVGTYEETGKPAVALTFDDGPSKQTDRILDILEENGVPATFFIVGKNASKFPDALKREVSLGCELGTHTWNHAKLTDLTSEQVDNQMNRSISAIEEASGGTVTLIRPPYGSVNSDLKEQLELPIILWSLDTLDWKTRDAQSTIDTVESSVKGGDIILFHDLYTETASAVEVIVPWLIENGYEILTVSELYEYYGEDLTLHKGHGSA